MNSKYVKSILNISLDPAQSSIFNCLMMLLKYPLSLLLFTHFLVSLCGVFRHRNPSTHVTLQVWLRLQFWIIEWMDFWTFKIFSNSYIKCWMKCWMHLPRSLTLLSPGGVIFARGKFKFKIFLIGLWYKPEASWLFPTFTRDHFAGKKNSNKY